MLSVVNRGTQIAEETDGIPYELIDGNEPYQFIHYPFAVIDMVNIPVPLEIGLEAIVMDGYFAYQETTVIDTEHMSIDITPTIVNGYTAITVNPTTR